MYLADGNGNLEILLYIIAAVVGIAINAYRNYAKRKAQELQRQGGEEPDFPEVLFGPDFAEQEVPVEERVYDELDQPVSIEDSIEKINEPTEQIGTSETIEEKEKEGVAAFSSTAEQLISDDVHESLTEISDELYSSIADSEHEIKGLLLEQEITGEDDFDLEKAVIFSEILNPKYINNYY